MVGESLFFVHYANLRGFRTDALAREDERLTRFRVDKRVSFSRSRSLEELEFATTAIANSWFIVALVGLRAQRPRSSWRRTRARRRR